MPAHALVDVVIEIFPLTVTGLVHPVRCRRLSPVEAIEDLKKARVLLTCSHRTT